MDLKRQMENRKLFQSVLSPILRTYKGQSGMLFSYKYSNSVAYKDYYKEVICPLSSHRTEVVWNCNSSLWNGIKAEQGRPLAVLLSGTLKHQKGGSQMVFNDPSSSKLWNQFLSMKWQHSPSMLPRGMGAVLIETHSSFFGRSVFPNRQH